MTDSIARQRVPVPLHYRHADRAQVLATLIHNLVTPQPQLGLSGLPLTTKSLTDPTVALLDCWATVADVIDFYQERIATEGFLDTATEPESVLALATLLGYRPRLGLAATCWLAYTLVVDPTDTAVLLPQGQLVQSIPAAGQMPQTFETTEDLVARPSWNTLQVKTTTPVTFDPDPSQYPDLVVSGATTPLVANDVVVVTLTSATNPLVLQVADVTTDFIANTTTVSLQQPLSTVAADKAVTPQAVAPQAVAPQAVASQAAAPGDTMLAKTQNLFKPLVAPPSVPPPTGAGITRDPTTLFPVATHDKEASPQLSNTGIQILAALHPGLSKALYPALASSTTGTPQVQSAQGMLISTAPFGVQVPPRPQIDRNGQSQPAVEWPIEDAQVLRIVFEYSGDDATQYNFAGAHVHVESSGGSGNATITAAAKTSPTLGNTTVKLDSTNSTITFDAHAPDETITVTIDSTNTITVTNTVTQATVSASLDDAIAAANAGANLPAPSDARSGVFLRIELLPGSSRHGMAAMLKMHDDQPTGHFIVDVVSALPLSDTKTLDLNEKRDEIIAGSYVVVDCAPPQSAQAGSISYPVVAQVLSANPVAVNRYGMSPTVTRLKLDSDWVSPNARLLSDLRPLTVYAQSVALDLQQVPITTSVSGSSIDVDGLHPGIVIGRRLIITGTRADLPDGTVQAGELIMVSGVTQTSSAGESPYTTFTLATPLSYRYQPATVKLYGNVVPAHQGATIVETLSSTGDLANPMFTLAQAPVLADPSGGPAGFNSTLTLLIDGRSWTPVPRLDANTPPYSYITGTDGQGHTTITLGQPLPQSASIAVATYRAGSGSAGNLAAGQVSQPLTRPLALALVTNPLPASGGSDPDGPDVVRANAPRGLRALGRVVSVQDAADLAMSWAGIGKATATLATHGGRQTVRLTVAGVTSSPLDSSSALITDLGAALTAAGDVTIPIKVEPAPVSLIVLVAQILHDPEISWDNVEPAVRAELISAYGYAGRGINEDIVISDLIAVIHRIEAVRSCSITGLGLIGADAQPDDVAAFAPGPLDQPIPVAGGQPITVTDGRIPVTGVACISDAVADTVILSNQQGAQR
jgi:predicted phage baseplate assembly protein